MNRHRSTPTPSAPPVGYAYALPAVIGPAFWEARLEEALGRENDLRWWLYAPWQQRLLSRAVLSAYRDLDALGCGERGRMLIAEAQGRRRAREARG